MMSKSRFGTLTAAIVWLFLAPPMAAQMPGQAVCDDALKHPDAALGACTVLIQQNAGSIDVLAKLYINRAHAHQVKQRQSLALAYFDAAIKLQPMRAETFRERGAVYLLTSNPDRGIQDFDEAIRLDPKSALAWMDRGLAYVTKHEIDRGIRDYDIALRIDLIQAILINRGNAYIRKGDTGRAVQDFDQLTLPFPSDAMPYYRRCDAYAIAGRLPEAITQCRQALVLCPGYAEALNDLAFTYLKLRQFDRAIGYYTDAPAACDTLPNA